MSLGSLQRCQVLWPWQECMWVSLHKKITARERAKTVVLHLGKKVSFIKVLRRNNTYRLSANHYSLFISCSRRVTLQWPCSRVLLLWCCQLCPTPISSPFQWFLNGSYRCLWSKLLQGRWEVLDVLSRLLELPKSFFLPPENLPSCAWKLNNTGLRGTRTVVPRLFFSLRESTWSTKSL